MRLIWCGSISSATSMLEQLMEQSHPSSPRSKAMQEFAVQDPKVKGQLAKERQAAAAADFDAESDPDWQTTLELDRHGNVKDSLTNIATIIRFDPNLQSIVFNEFKGVLDVVGDLPWKQVRPRLE